MNDSLYWYDLETTGTRPGQDRIVQFAGVRTDLDLNIVGEPVTLFCRLSDDVVPSAEAMLVTGITLAQLAAEGLSERDFSARILAEFSEPGTCVVGYNSLRFDDEFIRTLFYRNFHDPYTREWSGGNSRWDVIDFFRMACALRPEGVSWPMMKKGTEEGVHTFRLEALTTANGIAHESAHDAMSDVNATLAMTALVREAQPRLFSYLFGLRRKADVAAMVYPLGKQLLVHVSSMYPTERCGAALVVPLCQHPENPNGIICYDLSVDPSPLVACSAEEVRRLVFTSRIDLLPGEERIPLKVLHLNRCPAIAPLKTLDAASAQRLGLETEQAQAHLRQLQRAAGIVPKVQAAYSGRSFEPVADPDLMLYAGDFLNDDDRLRCNQVREMNAEELADCRLPFDDPRLPEMLFRYRVRNFPEHVDEQDKARLTNWLREKWSGGQALATALDEVNQKRSGVGPADVLLLDDLAERIRRQAAFLT